MEQKEQELRQVEGKIAIPLTPFWYSFHTLAELQALPNRADEMMTPEAARDFLIKLDYAEETWDELVEKGLISHETRAFIITARGDLPRLQYILTSRIRHDEGQLKDDLDPSLLFAPEEIDSGRI